MTKLFLQLEKTMNKIATKERSQGSQWTTHSERPWRLWSIPQMVNWEWLPLFPFKCFHGWEESLEMFLGHESAFSPGSWHLNKAIFSFQATLVSELTGAVALTESEFNSTFIVVDGGGGGDMDETFVSLLYFVLHFCFCCGKTLQGPFCVFFLYKSLNQLFLQGILVPFF